MNEQWRKIRVKWTFSKTRRWFENIAQWACGKIGHGERVWLFDEWGEEDEYICDRCKKTLYC